jgi:hypothetical protein
VTDDQDEEERVNLVKLEALRAAIDEGDACDPDKDIDGESLRQRLHQRMADRDAAEKQERTP